ncbi:endonuclease/exonuclease/phosphatase family protein [Neobacillus sp. YIM B06451]|uniref:endonuclease/exonuclease/phosphatase family protein n=1 Tax=Neobacillus sp. YIM B06451 TaxID=3070994 RepID=UPI00292F4314|nr:endonuclease/exonuclease/phosphatase family protein [Neobacillus sp. YIM B06451]
MTFNIRHGKGTDKKLNLERIARIINDSGADVIGLNEVDRFFSNRSGFLDQAKWLAEKLEMDHIYGPAVTMENREGGNDMQFGNAMLSRFPITEADNHPFDFLPKRAEARALLEAKVQIEGKELGVWVTHLSLGPFQHRKQIEFILEKAKKEPLPLLVMGDWNMGPSSRGWRKMTETFNDVWVETNEGPGGYTFPSRRPFRRLDYIFSTKNLKAISSEVYEMESNASDHLPLLATIRFLDS